MATRVYLLLTLCLLTFSSDGVFAQNQEVRVRELPLVWVLSTGGTIAGTSTSATDLSNYKSGSLLGEEIVRSVPQIKQFANVKVEQVVNVPSQDMNLK
ncbi:MAG: asparaginase domain-containing protein [Cyclobacteriaceae bacterium]|nr:asparaginase domain-containing protein [Cyclobacteriaceae bacterium]